MGLLFLHYFYPLFVLVFASIRWWAWTISIPTMEGLGDPVAARLGFGVAGTTVLATIVFDTLVDLGELLDAVSH